MTAPPGDDVDHRLLAVLARHLPRPLDSLEVDLTDQGLTSMQFVALLLDVEAEFGVSFGEDDLGAGLLSRPAATAAAVRRLRARAVPGS